MKKKNKDKSSNLNFKDNKKTLINTSKESILETTKINNNNNNIRKNKGNATKLLENLDLNISKSE